MGRGDRIYSQYVHLDVDPGFRCVLLFNTEVWRPEASL